MKEFWLCIIKPRGQSAKWLVLGLVVIILSLGATGWFNLIKQYTDTDLLTVKYGNFHISVYQGLKAAAIITLIFWVAAFVSDIAESRILKFKKMRVANRTLILKFVQIGIYFISFLFALDILGIDLTTLTVFSGALGIGIGFGLQKISSNFISGIILLLEKSIEQDDLIEMSDGIFGFVRKANARFTLIETVDGKEIFVPNEDFITSRVTNWTYSNPNGRIEINLGVSYGSDIEKARDLMLQTVAAHPKCITKPEPKCFLRNFGNSSVDFTLHFWVKDVTEGRWEPQSEVMFGIWNAFKENGIEIPFPQHDLHIKSHDKVVDGS